MNKIIIIFIVFLASCKEGLKSVPKPKNLISKDTMVMVLKDLSVLEAHIKLKYPRINENYKTIEKSGNNILKNYHLDTSRFDASMKYYGSNQAEMQEIYSQIIDSVNREHTELSKK